MFVPASVLNSYPSTKHKESNVGAYGGELGVNNYLMQFQMVAKYNGYGGLAARRRVCCEFSSQFERACT